MEIGDRVILSPQAQDRRLTGTIAGMGTMAGEFGQSMPYVLVRLDRGFYSEGPLRILCTTVVIHPGNLFPLEQEPEPIRFLGIPMAPQGHRPAVRTAASLARLVHWLRTNARGVLWRVISTESTTLLAEVEPDGSVHWTEAAAQHD